MYGTLQTKANFAMTRQTSVISVFNNKGVVGKTTLSFHLGHALADMGKKTLFVDLDPQCNLSIYALSANMIEELWLAEDEFIDSGFDQSTTKLGTDQFKALIASPRSIHFLLKPTEEGTGELSDLPPPIEIAKNLDLIPGRLTMHMYEDRISTRWSDIYRGDPLAIRTVTRIRSLIDDYAIKHGYDVVIVDTSPSLGSLNKVAISTVDGFLVPCLPDVFSLYGIKNIGRSVDRWHQEMTLIKGLVSETKMKDFPAESMKFLGFTIYNARKYTGSTKWDLAQAHHNYADRIPDTIDKYIPNSVRTTIDDDVLRTPIGGKAVMHSHNTLPSMANKYRSPMWRIPELTNLDDEDRQTILGNRKTYEDTKTAYKKFAKAVLERMAQAHGDVK